MNRRAPGSPGVPTPTLRPPLPPEAAAVQALWEESYVADDPGSRTRGGWSVETWATQQCALLVGDRIVGVCALRAEPQATATAARLALAVAHRQPRLAALLIEATIDMARKSNSRLIRLFSPARAAWTLDAARQAGFVQARSIYHMQLPGSVDVPAPGDVAGLRVRSMHGGEEQAILEALNRNWAGTWDFVPIRPEMLESDLEGQREGMLLAVDAADDSRILATCHAVFDPSDQNPDGDPRAWISNLTVDAGQRGLGLGRTMLQAGIAHLRSRGAGSITLGVDAGDPAPLTLYESVGFEPITIMQAWDKSLDS